MKIAVKLCRAIGFTTFLLIVQTAPSSPARAEGSIVWETTLTQFAFDDPVYSGTSPHLGITLGIAPNPDWEFGYTYETNLLFSPSIDGPDPDDSVSTRTQLLFAKRYWRLNPKTHFYAMLGGHQTEIETTAGAICLFCPGLISTRTTYDGKAEGIAWGLGVQWINSNRRNLSLRYIDYGSDDGEFSSLSLVFHAGFAG